MRYGRLQTFYVKHHSAMAMVSLNMLAVENKY